MDNKLEQLESQIENEIKKLKNNIDKNRRLLKMEQESRNKNHLGYESSLITTLEAIKEDKYRLDEIAKVSIWLEILKK